MEGLESWGLGVRREMDVYKGFTGILVVVELVSILTLVVHVGTYRGDTVAEKVSCKELGGFVSTLEYYKIIL